jgi:hypothetical protein
MTTELKRCDERGWRQCERDSYEMCMVCRAELCEPCYKRLRVYCADATWPVCSKPSCRRLVAIRERYGELVEAAAI